MHQQLWTCEEGQQVETSVSNGTGLFGTKGQRDTLKISCHGTGRAGTVCKNLGWDTGRDNHYFSVKIRDGTQDMTASWNTVMFRPFDFLKTHNNVAWAPWDQLLINSHYYEPPVSIFGTHKTKLHAARHWNVPRFQCLCYFVMSFRAAFSSLLNQFNSFQ